MTSHAAPASSVGCLATVLHNEAKGEDLKGQLLVAAVVLNRVRSADFPNNVCSVVNQEGQFNTDFVSEVDEAYITAELILTEELLLPKTDALYFHSGRKPSYLRGKKFLFQHGGHYFYE